jgi:hypothetical protein
MLRNRQVPGVVGLEGATRIVDEKTDPAPLTALVQTIRSKPLLQSVPAAKVLAGSDAPSARTEY